MTIERGFAAVVARRLGAAALLTWLSASGWTAPPPEPPAGAQAAQQVVNPEGLRARLLRDEAPVRSLDPAIFTDLSPVSASDPALRLPPDQQEAE
jgi:hypothetical protein